jgi:hypothetical protein
LKCQENAILNSWRRFWANKRCNQRQPDLKKAQIAPIGAVHAVRLRDEHQGRAQAERYLSRKRDCQNQPINALRTGERCTGQAKAAGFATIEQSFDGAFRIPAKSADLGHFSH